MREIFKAIEDVAFAIDNAIKTSDLGYSHSENSSGEEQLKLDVQSDLIIEDRFSSVGSVKALVSEEKEGLMDMNEGGKYTLCYDPLDGSSLVDVNLSVGSIFGIYENELEGRNIVASAYVVYGPRVELVWIEKGKTPTLYRAINGEFKEIGEIKLNEKGKLNASGGTQQHWEAKHKAFIDGLFASGYRLRYSGGMVPDLHQILLKGGGLFSYPATTDKPNGKLRQLFEVIPFALIYEGAGGKAINDKGNRLLELIPSHPHDTSPCFFGSNSEINALKDAYGV
ncbi:Fructose-1,6-bisphosphatase, type I [hydrothermal vent metagenome]|uniref:fructose-bisphosphatase n=1 Tax=hydrothermal vent metagenome TaxID=652676 RepID=A0A1W1EJB5_9ZZZZ